MPSRWSAEVYDYDAGRIAHEDFHSVDVEEGRWFMCNHCTNPLNAEGKFTCRAFAAQELVGDSRGHITLKGHRDRKAVAAAAIAPEQAQEEDTCV